MLLFIQVSGLSWYNHYYKTGQSVCPCWLSFQLCWATILPCRRGDCCCVSGWLCSPASETRSRDGCPLPGCRPPVISPNFTLFGVYSLYNYSDITFQNTIKDSLSHSPFLCYCECLTGVIIQTIKHILTASIFYIELFHHDMRLIEANRYNVKNAPFL